MIVLGYRETPGGSKKDRLYFIETCEKRGFPVIYYKLDPGFFLYDLVYYNFLLLFTIKEDSILVFDRRDLLFLVLTKFFKRNFILFRSGTNAELKLKFHKLFLWIPNNIIAVSKNAMHEFRNFGFSCDVYFPAFCYESIGEFDLNKDDNYLVYAGKISKNKGVLELAQFCENNNLNLKIAGFRDRNDLSYYDSFLLMVNSSTNITFLGTLDEFEVVNLIKRSSGYISNSVIEGFPIVFLYCLQHGLPILTKRYLNFPDELSLQGIRVFDDISELSGLQISNLIDKTTSLDLIEHYKKFFSNDYKFLKIEELCRKYYL
jgi:glycosyltransferase involved in cell wall biosynthesis